MAWSDRGFWSAEALEPVRRFPLPVLCAVLATAVNWSGPAALTDSRDGQVALTLYLAGAFLWTWAAALWAESQGSRVKGIVIAMAGAVALAVILRPDKTIALWLSGVSAGERIGGPSTLLLFGALLLAPSIAPFLPRSASQSAFWQYNHKWLVGLLAGCVGSLLAVAGVMAILGTAALIFEITVSAWVSQRVWLLSYTLVMPWIWLSLSPLVFDEEIKTGAEQEFTSRAVGLPVVAILVPVMLALSALLVAYVVKVAADGSWLKARLGLTGAAYGASVILVGLLAYPQRNVSPLVRLFWRLRPYLLIAPTLLFFPALWVRIVEYGWTPARYLALLVGLWIAGGLLTGLIARWRRRQDDLRMVPGLAALLLAAATFGPWGIDAIAPSGRAGRTESPRAAPPPGTRIFFTASQPITFAIPGMAGTVIGLLSVTNLAARQSFDTPEGRATLIMDGRQLHLDLGEARIASFDLSPTLDRLKSEAEASVTVIGGARSTRGPAILLEGTNPARTRLVLTSVSGMLRESQSDVQVSAHVMLLAPQ
jgi:hypothetical protein